MEMTDAVLAVLRDAPGEDLHWTVLWDRALRDGFVDAFTQAGERNAFLRALTELAGAGLVEKTSKGTYRVVEAPGAGRR